MQRKNAGAPKKSYALNKTDLNYIDIKWSMIYSNLNMYRQKTNKCIVPSYYYSLHLAILDGKLHWKVNMIKQ